MKVFLRVAVVSFGISTLAATAATNDSSRFHFRAPHRVGYRLADESVHQRVAATRAQWIEARVDGNSTNRVELGSRVVLQLRAPEDLKRLTAGSSLELSRTVRSNIFILQAPDALTAAQEAERLAALDEVEACYPVMRRLDAQHGPYAQRSDDPFAIPFFISGGGQTIEAQWPLEDRDGFSTRLGLDLNVMSAWPFTFGEGVTVAVADGGLEMNHPELVNRLAGAPHYNFVTDSTNNPGPIGGGQSDINRGTWTHGTSVAGIIAAERNNGRGVSGIAPKSQLASWLIFTTNTALVSDERLMEMYVHAEDVVDVQNHSWGAGNGLRQQDGPSLLEQIGIEEAITLGRGGLGVVMVRSAGNDREITASANDDGYPNSPDVVTVGAVQKDGRVTFYSEPGACVLVAAPGGGGTDQNLLTLDLVGWDRGVNSGIFYGGDLADYRWGVQGFSGTSAAAPHVSGIVALMLSANPNLSYRDVQHILVLAARHWSETDPDLVTNGAGLRVSHNIGFGVPDAGLAVQLARTWPNRPPLVTLNFADTQSLPIPDNGLRVEVDGTDIPPSLATITAFLTYTPGLDDPTPALKLVDIGVATNVPAVNLTNKGALILRDNTPFTTKIANAAAAGASFAIIYNWTNAGGFDLGLIAGTDFSPIPTVFIGNSAGEGLKALFETNSSALARLRLVSADKTFHVGSTLLCEHVGVRVRTDHPVRGDLRITLRSPAGTRSVLQHFNDDANPGPVDWTYWTTHHFLESSAGDWTVSISDEFGGNVGNVLGVNLIIRGTEIVDTDHDGLDDMWETTRLNTLAYGPKDDPDGDGYCNAREQVACTNPLASDILGLPDLSRWGLFGSSMMRLSWPSAPQYNYDVFTGSDVASLTLFTNVPGRFAETEIFVPFSQTQNSFFKIVAHPAP